jgi:type IV pilus assembly protein PilM
MFKNTYKAFFPTPKFLSMPSFGLDISDESLKYMQLTPTRDGLRPFKYGERKIPAGVIDEGRIVNSEKLEEIILELKKELKIKAVRVSIQENQVYLFKMSIPKEGLTSIKEAIELSLEEHIPVPAPEAIFDFDIIEETETDLDLQVAAISKGVIENYLSVFKNCSISVYSFELEAQSTARALLKKGDMGAYMIVDFGEKRTGIFIVSKGIVMFTSTLNIGGAILNNMIQKNFKVDVVEAEKMKRAYGLSRSAENREIFSVLLNSVSVLRDELVKHYTYWSTHKDEEGRANPLIKKVILCGGGANLSGLAEYLSVSMRAQVEMANAWTNVLDTEKIIPEIPFEKSISFAASIGLSLGDFEEI